MRISDWSSDVCSSDLLCFGLAAVAATIGIAAIIGAFLAGMALAEATEKEHETHERVRGVTEFLTPFFLVSIGMQLNLEAFTRRQTIVASLGITVLERKSTRLNSTQ